MNLQRTVLFLLIILSFSAKGQTDTLIVEYYRLDLRHVDNQLIKDLPKFMIYGATYGALWAHYETESYDVRLSRSQLLDRLGLMNGVDSIKKQSISDSIYRAVSSDFIAKNLKINSLRIMTQEQYDEKGNITSLSYSDENMNRFDNGEEARIRFITLVNEKGIDIASFDYLVLCQNLMINNPRCSYINKQGERISFVDFFEKGLFYAMEE